MAFALREENTTTIKDTIAQQVREAIAAVTARFLLDEFPPHKELRPYCRNLHRFKNGRATPAISAFKLNPIIRHQIPLGSGPATGSFNGLHPKSKLLAFTPTSFLQTSREPERPADYSVVTQSRKFYNLIPTRFV